MNDEIKLILGILDKVAKGESYPEEELYYENCQKLLDYITTLQNENKHLNLQLDQALKDYDELQEENKKFQSIISDYVNVVLHDRKEIDRLINIIKEARKMIFDNYGLLDKYGIEILDDILKGE